MPICLPFVAVNISETHLNECFVSGWGLQASSESKLNVVYLYSNPSLSIFFQERGSGGQDEQLETNGEDEEGAEEQQEADEELPGENFKNIIIHH